MIEYIKLSEYIKFNMDIDFLINNILRITVNAKKEYPNYANWFINKHIPGLYNGNRDTIIAVDKNKQLIVGVCNIKKGKEKKICTLYLDPSYRRNKLGDQLVRIAVEELECDKPLITMPSTSIGQFKNIIKTFDWQITDVVKNMYKDNTNEIIFNGIVLPEQQELSHDENIILSYKKSNDKNILKLLNSKKEFFKLNYLGLKEKISKKVLSN